MTDMYLTIHAGADDMQQNQLHHLSKG